MLAQPTEDEGTVSERPSETQPTPSSFHLSEDPIEPQPDPSLRPSSSNPILDSIPEGSGGNHRGQSSNDRSLSGNEDGLTLQSVYDLCVSLCKQVTTQAAQIKDLNVSMKKRLARKKSLKKKLMQKESISKQGRKPKKSEPTMHKDLAFDDFDVIVDDAVDYIETKDARDEGRTSSKTLELSLSGDTVVLEEKESVEKGVSTEDPVRTAQPKVSTDKPKVSTDKPKDSTNKDNEGTAEPKDGKFRNKVKQKEKEKGVGIKNVEDIERPRPTSTRSLLTLKPLPKIDPKAKRKGMIKEEDESDTESEDITEAEKKFKMLANDEEMARKVQEEWEAKEEKERLDKEEVTKVAFTNEYDFIQARLNANKILAEKLQEEEREKFTIEERAKLLHDTIAAQRIFLAQQRSEVKRSDENFIAIGSVEDERLIKDLNKKIAGIKKHDSIKEENKEEEGTKKRKLATRKKMKLRKRRFRQDTSEDENDELRLCLTIAPDEDKEVDYEILDKKYPIIEWKSKCQDEIPDDFDKVLWGDLMIMFNSSNEDEFWNSQQDWNRVISLTKHTLERMMDLRLTVVSDDDTVFDLLSTNNVNATSTNEVNAIGAKTSIELPIDLDMPELEDISLFELSGDDEDVGAEADINNLDTTIQVSPILTTKIHKDHPLDQVIRDLQSATQTRRMLKNLEAHGFVSTIQQRTNHKDLQKCLFACFLSIEEPKKVIHALKDPSWIEAIQEELLQFKLVAQGYTQEEGIDYDEVFAPVAIIETIRLFLAYASFKDFMVYQMDIKSAFLYGKIEEEVYVCQPPGFEDPDFPNRVYKVEKVLYGLHQAPRAWHKGDILLVQVYVDDIIFGSTKKELCNAFEKLMHEKFQMSSMGELTFFLGLQLFTEVKTTSTPTETQKPLIKDEDGEDVDVHMYRSMIGSLMYLISSRPDIMFAVCACARYQVNLKVSHLHAVKRIFRYLKGQPKLGLWYPTDSPFDLVAYTNSDYAGASLDKNLQ
ncbi:putative ribonuclease H-like domain-containing protein [Tanacetum coccineum]